MKTCILLLMLAGWTGASAQDWQVQPQSLASGAQQNLGSEPALRFVGLLTATKGTRVRVHFNSATLGRSQLRLTAVHDGQSQTLGADGLILWDRTSAIFNGGNIRLELLLAPGETNVSVAVDHMLVDGGGALQDAGFQAPVGRTLCGADNRVASTDNRVGRINGSCTGWLVANGAVLTAGHCRIVAGSILEVNVPASQANGARVAAAVQDQFPVLAGSITTVTNGVGDDWTVCRVGPNNLGQSAHVLHGFFRMTRELPGVDETIRITGCGIDNTPQGSQPSACGNQDNAGTCTHFGLNAQSQTLQTSTGGFTGESGSEPQISLQYAVDTEPANSGSPIIWEATGFAVGIHTAGGCTSSGGANNGTSFELNALELAIAAVPGPNARYLDTLKVPGGAEDGTVFQPHDTLSEAANAVPAGGRLSIVRGTYFGTANRGLYSKAMTLSAPVGAVILGQ